MGRRAKKGQRPRHFLREWRKNSGLSLEAVAERLEAASRVRSSDGRSFRRLGITHGNLSRIERGLVPYSQTLLEHLAELYGTHPSSLIAHDPSEPGAMWPLWQGLTADEKAKAAEIINLLKRKS